MIETVIWPNKNCKIRVLSKVVDLIEAALKHLELLRSVQKVVEVLIWFKQTDVYFFKC